MPRISPPSTADAGPRRFVGDFIAWPGGAILIGEGSGEIAPHSHYAIQCAIGMPDGLRVRLGREGQWQSVAGALIASRAMHTIDVNDCRWSAVLFVEPETRVGQAIAARLRDSLEVLPAKTVAGAATRLEQAWRIERSEQAVRGVCAAWLQELADIDAPPPPDTRVLAAIERISTSAGEPSLESLAASAHLSPSRFRHLFVAAVGMPLRTYLLWRRLLRAWEEQMRGENITGAAHATGFADAAHLSRTCRAMFGLAPSAMAMAGPISQRRRDAQSA